MNAIVLLSGVFTLILMTPAYAKSTISKKAKSFIDKELQNLKANTVSCSLSPLTLRHLTHLRITEQFDKGRACHVEYLLANQNDAWGWSSLGQLLLLNREYFDKAQVCFDESIHHKSALLPVDEWLFIGPFVMGKTEFDGDPLEEFGGVRNMSSQRLKKNLKLYSELGPNGEIRFSAMKVGGNGQVALEPPVTWNDLVSTLASTGIYEWQGWLIGELGMNSDGTVMVQCHGTHTVYIDDNILPGDVYYRQHLWFPIFLCKGIHTVYIKARAKGRTSITCNFRLSSEQISVISPVFLPQIWGGHLFSQHIPLLVRNNGPKWLKVISVRAKDQQYGAAMEAEIDANSKLSIAPGQTRPINVRLYLNGDGDTISSDCQSVEFTLKITTSEGPLSTPIKLICRSLEESVVFTFVDHDGSCQQAAALQPLNSCSKCPVLLTLHGTTIPPQQQADSYKRMVDGKFVFGEDNTWVLAPTRHGAHNWEGPGSLTALTAVKELCTIVDKKGWLKKKADCKNVVITGHSMGGHGAWHIATHFPDTALALIVLAGWYNKEEYGDSNLFFRHDISNSYVDPSVKAIMEACIAENNADRMVSNLKGIPVLMRIGSNDRTVHPFFMRRMFRLLKSNNVSVTYIELEGKDHWWWDTFSTNDGGCVNDPIIRDFVDEHLNHPQPLQVCSKDSCNVHEPVVYTVMNPAFGGSMHGLQILQQKVPMRTSKITAIFYATYSKLQTTNVAVFSVSDDTRRMVWCLLPLEVDGKIFTIEDVQKICAGHTLRFDDVTKEWTLSTDGTYHGRTAVTYGPARRIAEKPFVIISGTKNESLKMQNAAVYLANLFFVTSDTNVPIIKDMEVSDHLLQAYNLILLGNPDQNVLTLQFLNQTPLKFGNHSITLGGCVFTQRTGVLTLAPHGSSGLALILMGVDNDGMQDVLSLAQPTIPPMTRSPFSNLIPDFVLTSEHYRARGPGGFDCAGFWGNHWELRADLISCSYCMP